MFTTARIGYTYPMHPIQASILSLLIRHPKQRFADLKPEDMDPHLFMYHFKKLLGAGLVEKQDDVYVLTTEGIRHASHISSRTLMHREQPTVCTMVACQNSTGEWLLHTRGYQPFLGKQSFPYGKLHWGETLEQAARRELTDKTGVIAEGMQLVGNCYLIIKKDGEVVSHILFHIFNAENTTGSLLAENEKGYSNWTRITDPNDTQFIPGFSKIYEIATTSSTAVPTIEIDQD
jgi:8-oxo-dGTP diphosphatase